MAVVACDCEFVTREAAMLLQPTSAHIGGGCDASATQLWCGVVAMASAGHGSLNVCLCTFRSQHTATASLAVASTCSGVSVSAVPVLHHRDFYEVILGSSAC